MTDSLAGRRALEFFGLLAISPAAKKEEIAQSQWLERRVKKVALVERPRKSK